MSLTQREIAGLTPSERKQYESERKQLHKQQRTALGRERRSLDTDYVQRAEKKLARWQADGGVVLRRLFNRKPITITTVDGERRITYYCDERGGRWLHTDGVMEIFGSASITPGPGQAAFWQEGMWRPWILSPMSDEMVAKVDEAEKALAIGPPPDHTKGKKKAKANAGG